MSFESISVNTVQLMPPYYLPVKQVPNVPTLTGADFVREDGKWLTKEALKFSDGMSRAKLVGFRGETLDPTMQVSMWEHVTSSDFKDKDGNIIIPKNKALNAFRVN